MIARGLVILALWFAVSCVAGPVVGRWLRRLRRVREGL